MSFNDWYHQDLYQALDHFADPDGSSSSSDCGLGPSDELCRLAFKQIIQVEDQCIDPSILQLVSRQPGQVGRSSFLDHVIEGESRSETSFSHFNRGLPFPYSSFSDIQDIRNPTEIDEDFFDDLEVGELVNLDNFFSDTPEVPGHIEIDGYFFGTAEDPETTETDKQFFDHLEIREVVGICDKSSDTRGTPEPMDIDSEEPGKVSDLAPLSPAPLPPLSSSLSPGLCPTEGGEALYLVERVIQAWGPKHRRQYLIRWEGWGPEYDSWEPACNLSQELKTDFERSRRRLIRPRR